MDRFWALIENSPKAISMLNVEGDPADRDDSVRILKTVLAQPESHSRIRTRVRAKERVLALG